MYVDFHVVIKITFCPLPTIIELHWRTLTVNLVFTNQAKLLRQYSRLSKLYLSLRHWKGCKFPTAVLLVPECCILYPVWLVMWMWFMEQLLQGCYNGAFHQLGMSSFLIRGQKQLRLAWFTFSCPMHAIHASKHLTTPTPKITLWLTYCWECYTM